MEPFSDRQSTISIDQVLRMVQQRNEADVSGYAPAVLMGDKCAIMLANEVIYLRRELELWTTLY